MPWSMAAAAVGAAGSLGSAAMQSGNASKAAGQSTRNLQMMLPQFQQTYNQQVGQFQPYAAVGPAAVKQQQDLLGLNGPDAAAAAMQTYQTSPGYQWQVQQALRGVDAGAAANEMLRSGATLKAEQDRAQQLANLDFSNYFNRLGTMANTGFQGATGIVNAGNNLNNAMTGNVASQNAVNLGAANAQNSILGNATSGLSNTVNSLFSNPQFQKWAGGLFSGGSTFNPAGGLTNTAGTSAGYGDQLFQSGGVF